ncbi:NADPH-dependent FMN reductase [Silvimonas amylolytica]|uniref:NAD(P)H-dependent FMN reductase n=1 Tax=Silvimonas amylolytica TaxID=449663 RepID=A0ABQ2PL20_9NEIS|nr:NADPH-dependent FMN reductase [Silvimonas amylolytica]GGP25920.1 NAD(P)H-dependent FMN reductase [Silvimonas amylolytica]
MPVVVTLSGSPSARSRSQGLLNRAAQVLVQQGITIQSFSLSDFPPDALLYAQFDHPSIARLQDAIAGADGVLVSTPVYKAAYSGALKVVLDVLPERALAHHVVLPLATGGSPAHMLAVDYALQPVLTALKARHVLGGIYATDKELTWEGDILQLSPEIDDRLHVALARFIAHLPNPGHVQLDPDTLHAQLRLGRVSL